MDKVDCPFIYKIRKEKGTAKVQAVVGNKKYTCKVTVAAKAPASTPTPPTKPTEIPVPTPSTETTETPVPTTSVSPSEEPSNIKVIEYAGASDPKNAIRDAEKEGVLYKVVVKDGVTSIGLEAFWECSSLEKIIWKDTTYNSVESFESAFGGFD